MKRLIVVALAALVLAGCASAPTEPSPWQRYRDACNRKGGEVSTSEVTTWTRKYKCIDLERNRDDLLPEFVEG